MRAREMHNKLDKLSVPSEDDEHWCPDISLLSPEDQDWVNEMFEKIRASEDGPRNVITDAEARKLIDLLNALPLLGRDDKFAGPDLNIPREIEDHFELSNWDGERRHHLPRFKFHKLKAVQKVRFVELCRKYGWEGEYPRCHSRYYHVSGRWGIPNLLPVNQWDPDDEAELRSLLDQAAQ